MRVLRRFVDNTDPGSYANRLRERRFSLFRSLIARLEPPIRVLDVGGTPGFWRMRGYDLPGDPSVVVLNLEAMQSDDRRVTTVVGNGLDMRDIPDRAFDVVFSNAVIEHVETLENQRLMAAEIRRVGKRYFVQTPNKHFPLEPHFLVPGFQFLPLRLRAELLRWVPLGWYGRTADRADAERKVRTIRLMTEREFQSVFPEAQIHREKVLGITKSFIAIGGW
jgi:SAM-dependent methyltransferase